jgi:hypothetical protein
MAPASEFLPYAEMVQMASGASVGRGFPVAIWKWEGTMRSDLFAALRAICPGASADVYIRTLLADYSTYAYYTAKMQWPALDSYEQKATRRQGVIIRFTHLVSYTPST